MRKSSKSSLDTVPGLVAPIGASHYKSLRAAAGGRDERRGDSVRMRPIVNDGFTADSTAGWGRERAFT